MVKMIFFNKKKVEFLKYEVLFLLDWLVRAIVGSSFTLFDHFLFQSATGTIFANRPWFGADFFYYCVNGIYNNKN